MLSSAYKSIEKLEGFRLNSRSVHIHLFHLRRRGRQSLLSSALAARRAGDSLVPFGSAGEQASVRMMAVGKTWPCWAGLQRFELCKRGF